MKSSVPNPELWRAQERVVLLCLVLSVGVALPSIVVAVRSESVLLLSDVLDYVRAIVVSLLAWRILRAGRTAGAQGFDYGTGRLQTLGGVVGAPIGSRIAAKLPGVVLRGLMSVLILNSSIAAYIN